MPMNPVITELEQNPDNLQSHWCLPREEARFLYLLTVIGRFRDVLEVGTSIGYSTLHLAQAVAENDGQVVTIDASAERQAEAHQHLQAAGLANRVSLLQGDALTRLAELTATEQRFDLMFVDARKSEYIQYLALAETLLRPGGVLVADNTRSHRSKMLDFVEAIHQSPVWEVSDLETPSGIIMARNTMA
jgi:predicted O-methyltransferase YrrM